MVSFSPLSPLLVEPKTLHEYLHWRVDVMLTQLNELMHHFCTMSATPATTPGTYVADSPLPEPMSLILHCQWLPLLLLVVHLLPVVLHLLLHL
jgi:hypothetical protein